jgi:hypothetical protein
MRTSRFIGLLGCARTWVFSGALAWALVACGESPRIVRPSPISPTSPEFPAPQPNPPTGPAPTGFVFATTEHGRRPVAGAHIFAVDLVEGPYGDYGWSELVSDVNGRFSVPTVFAGRRVKLTAYDGPGSGLWNQSGFSQLCAVHPIVDEETTADIELVQSGLLPATYGSPTLSGVIFELSTGRRPVAGTPVLYSSNSHDGADVYARTDANGRYNFCRLPLGPGYVLAGCPGAVTPFREFRFTQVPVEIRGDTVLDVDITSSISSCP